VIASGFICAGLSLIVSSTVGIGGPFSPPFPIEIRRGAEIQRRRG
jgi:hypothetical protein